MKVDEKNEDEKKDTDKKENMKKTEKFSFSFIKGGKISEEKRKKQLLYFYWEYFFCWQRHR